MSQPKAMRFWSTPPHTSLHQTEEFVGKMIQCFEEGNEEFIIEAGDHVIGKLGAWRLPEIGFLVAPEHWGKGYASEALSTFIEHRRAKGSVELTADTDPRNEASIRLLEKHGFHEVGRAERTWRVGDEWVDSVYFRLAL
jgi:RimJ/RimL family protein N-acetyltransferase